MDPNNKSDLTPEEAAKQQAAFEKKMEEEHSISFKFKELLVIFNVLTKVQGTYGDFKAISPIVEKLNPIVAVDSNIPPQADPAPQMVGINKKVN